MGYRMPAEWEPHQATWISWPHNPETWPGCLERVILVFARLVTQLSMSEAVHINVNDASMERQALRLIKGAGACGDIHFHHFPTNDAWCRDYGALFVRRDGRYATRVEPDSMGRPDTNGLAAVDWGFNSWGNKYLPCHDGNQIASRMAEVFGVRRFVPKMVMEGGSIDVDGQGLLVTTESCLLNPNRNPDLRREEIEQGLVDYLGIDRVLWLKSGIVGDDTDGHVDNAARFVAPGMLVTVNPDGSNDQADEAFREN